MSRKLVLLTSLIIVLVGTLGIAFEVQTIQASQTIYITADGSIEPPTAPINRVGDVYTFTGSVTESVYVQRDNVVIDGAGYTIQGAGTGYGVYLNDRAGVTLKNLEVTGFNIGILLSSSENCLLADNTVLLNSAAGIRLNYCSDTRLVGNKVTNSSPGIYLRRSSGNELQDNKVTDNEHGYGLRFDESGDNLLVENEVTGNHYGAYFGVSSNNTLVSNTISQNNPYGVRLDYSSFNMFYHNNFVDNPTQVYSTSSINSWNNSYPLCGNYWSDYDGIDTNPDGIGDSWYEIDDNNIDHYPLMGIFSSFNTSLGYQVNVISNSAIGNFQYFEPNSTIRMYASNMTASQTYGFVRICIPHALMSEPYNVTVDGANPTYWDYMLYDDGDNRWIYISYEHSTLEIIIIPEFPSFLILPLFMVTTLLAVIIYRRVNSKQDK